MKKENKAQSYLEYGVLIALVAIALVAMRMYFVRAVQEKYRQSADVFGEGEQYVKGATKVTEKSSFTDISETPDSRNPCPSVTAQVAGLEREIQGYDMVEEGVTTHFKGLLERAASFEDSANQARQNAQVLLSSGAKDAIVQVTQIQELAAELDKQANTLRQQAQEKQSQIDKLKKDYADCF